MADCVLTKESNEILKQFSIEKDERLMCPILKVLQMRHHDLDIKQARRVVKNILE